MKRCLNVLLLALVMAVAMMGVSFAQEDDDSKGQNAEKVKLYKDHIYWIDKDTEKIYVSKLGDGQISVFTEVPDCGEKMAVHDGYIYYNSYKDGGIVKLSIVGKNETLIRADDCGSSDLGIWNGKIYFKEYAYSGDGKEDDVYICSMGLNGGDFKRIAEADCNAFEIYDGKVYFTKWGDCGGIYSCDLSNGDIVKISEKYADEIQLNDDKVYFRKNGVLNVMNIDGSGCEYISKGIYEELKFYGGQVYSIYDHGIERLVKGSYDVIYENRGAEIEGAIFKDSKAYVISANDIYESDVLNPESNQVVSMDMEIDSAYIKDGKMYYQDSRILKSYDLLKKTERIIDLDVEEIFDIKDGYIYYSVEKERKMLARRAKLDTGENELLADIGEDPEYVLIAGKGIYYLEWIDDANDSDLDGGCNERLVFIDLGASEKKKTYLDIKGDCMSRPVDAGSYIFSYTSEGLYRIDKDTNVISRIGYMDGIVAVDAGIIYDYNPYEYEIALKDLDGNGLEKKITGISSEPYFNGRYFINYDDDRSKIVIVDSKDNSRREVAIELEYLDIVKTQSFDHVYFSDGSDTKLMALDLSDFSVRLMSEGEVYLSGSSYGQSAVVNRRNKECFIETVGLSNK